MHSHRVHNNARWVLDQIARLDFGEIIQIAGGLLELAMPVPVRDVAKLFQVRARLRNDLAGDAGGAGLPGQQAVQCRSFIEVHSLFIALRVAGECR